jgi:hypothetical protein
MLRMLAGVGERMVELRVGQAPDMHCLSQPQERCLTAGVIEQ